MAQGALGAAGVRRVGYGVEVDRSGSGEGGILCRHAHSLLFHICVENDLLFECFTFLSASER